MALPFWTKKTMAWARARRGYIACQALICGSWVSLNELIRSSDAGAAKSDTTLTANLRSARRAREPQRAPFGLKPGNCPRGPQVANKAGGGGETHAEHRYDPPPRGRGVASVARREHGGVGRHGARSPPAERGGGAAPRGRATLLAAARAARDRRGRPRRRAAGLVKSSPQPLSSSDTPP